MSAWDYLPGHLIRPTPVEPLRDCFAMEGIGSIPYSGGVPPSPEVRVAENWVRLCPACGRRSVAVQPDGGLRCTVCEPGPGSRIRHIRHPDGSEQVDTGWGPPPAGPPCPWCSDARAPDQPAERDPGCRPQLMPPLVDIRQAGPYGSELLVMQDGHTTVVPLNYGQLVNLLERATAGIRRCDEAR